VPDPIAKGVDVIGLPWFSVLIKLGALTGLTTVILVLLYGQSRIFFTMSSDGLMPAVFSRVHPTLRTPYLSQLLIGTIVACVAALTPIEVLGEMVSIGTLFAFVLVCAAVIYLRCSDADVARPFRVPNCALGSDPRHSVLPLAHARSAAHNLGSAGGLASYRPRDLFRLWQASFPATPRLS
jgi:APA family basic amino acid/polyamine antiporter